MFLWVKSLKPIYASFGIVSRNKKKINTFFITKIIKNDFKKPGPVKRNDQKITKAQSYF